MTRCRVPNSSYEVAAAIGRRTGQRRKVLAVAAYIPPSYNANENKGCLEHICDVIISLKNRYNDPYVILGGDFNKREIIKAIREFKDIKVIKTGPTRGRSTLDIFASNLQDIKEAGTIAPVVDLSLIHI